jgi:hypothetical protein
MFHQGVIYLFFRDRAGVALFTFYFIISLLENWCTLLLRFDHPRLVLWLHVFPSRQLPPFFEKKSILFQFVMLFIMLSLTSYSFFLLGLCCFPFLIITIQSLVNFPRNQVFGCQSSVPHMFFCIVSGEVPFFLDTLLRLQIWFYGSHHLREIKMSFVIANLFWFLLPYVWKLQIPWLLLLLLISSCASTLRHTFYSTSLVHVIGRTWGKCQRSMVDRQYRQSTWWGDIIPPSWF